MDNEFEMMKEETEEKENSIEEAQVSAEEKRRIRRARRIRNQVIVYLCFLLFLALLAAGIFYGMKHLTNNSEANTESSVSIEESSMENISSEVETEPSTVEESFVEEPSEPESEEVDEQEVALSKLDAIINEKIASMSLESKVAGLFIVTPEALTNVKRATKAGDSTKKALTAYPVGGLIYFNTNISTKEQIVDMITNTKLFTEQFPPFLAIDEEGGDVAMLANSGVGTKVDSAAKIGAAGDVYAAFEVGRTLGKNVAAVGMNVDFAPVADLKSGDKSYIGNRSYGSDVETIANMVTAVMQGIQSEGVTACLKHFPGLGSATQDPHKGVSGTDRTAEQFRNEDLLVFQAGIDNGVGMIMISNMSASALTGNDLPCMFSKELVTDLLRNEMGFNGVIVTDAMDMGAVSEYYSAEEAAIMSLKAGCDMILMPEDFKSAYAGVIKAVQDGTIAEERINDSLRRIYRIKYAGRENE